MASRLILLAKLASEKHKCLPVIRTLVTCALSIREVNNIGVSGQLQQQFPVQTTKWRDLLRRCLSDLYYELDIML